MVAAPATVRTDGELPSVLRLSSGLWTLRWILFLLLAAALPLWLGLFGAHFGDAFYSVTVFLLVASAWSVAKVVTHVRPQLVALTFWVFVYIWCGLAPLSQTYPDQWPLPGQYGEADRRLASLLTLAGVASWVAGYRWIAGRRSIEVARMVDPRKVHYLGILGLLLALGAIGVLGPSTFFSSRQELQDAIDRAVGGGPAQAQLFMGLVIVPPTLALFLLLWGRNAIGWRRTAAADILMAALLLVVATVANPIVNSRFLSGSVIVALLVGSSRRVGTTRFSRQIGSAVLVAVLLVFPIADFARFADGGTSKEFGLDRTLFTGGDYDAFQQTMNGVRYVEVRGVSDGTQAIGAALFWVPRQAWAGKPEPTGVVVARDAGYTFLNLSSPAWLEGYVDFLWIGAFAFGLLLGMISARLDRGFYERTFSIWASLAPLYIGYQIIILRGTLMGVIPVLVLWALLTAAVTRRAPVGTSASESAW